MSSHIKIGASAGSDAFVKFNDGSSDKVILKHDDNNNLFQIFKDISGSSTEIMRFDENGNIDFISSVKFSGGSSLINTETLSLQDQQVEIGLKDSFQLKSVSINGNDFTFTVSNPRSDGSNVYSTGTYVYFQNVKNSSNAYISGFQDSLAVTASDTTTFTVNVSGVSDTINFNHIPAVSELVALTQNTGLQILAKDSSNNLVRAALKYKSDSDKSLQLENNAGSIDIGSENNNFEITIGESGNRNIKIGSSTAQDLTIDASQNIKIGFTQSCPVDFNATTLDIDASGALTLDSATSISIGATADVPLDINASTLDIDASGALTLDSATSISIGATADVPVDIDASTLDIDASSTTNIKTTGANMTISTITSGDMTQSSAGILDIDASGALTLDSATSISIGGTADVPVDIDASTLDIDASSTTNIKTTGANMTISTITSGNMIQSSAGTYDLDVSGDLSINSSGGVINIGNDNVSQNINIGTNGTRTITIGKDGVGTFQVDSENVVFTNSTQFSDSRLKENLNFINNHLEKVNNLNGYYYNWIKDENKKTNIGFIAQEVEKEFPMLITEQENGYKSVNYIGMIPVLLECIKTQNQKIETLNQKLDELSKKI